MKSFLPLVFLFLAACASNSDHPLAMICGGGIWNDPVFHSRLGEDRLYDCRDDSYRVVSPENTVLARLSLDQFRSIMDDQKCQSMGLAPLDERYPSCRMRLMEIHAQADAATRQRQAAALRAFVESQQSKPQPTYSLQLPQRQSIRCTTQYIGDYSYTNCN